jgi:hypothetical protein
MSDGGFAKNSFADAGRYSAKGGIERYTAI